MSGRAASKARWAARASGGAHLQHPADVWVVLRNKCEALGEARRHIEAGGALEDLDQILDHRLHPRSDLPAGAVHADERCKVQLRQHEVDDIRLGQHGLVQDTLSSSVGSMPAARKSLARLVPVWWRCPGGPATLLGSLHENVRCTKKRATFPTDAGAVKMSKLFRSRCDAAHGGGGGGAARGKTEAREGEQPCPVPCIAGRWPRPRTRCRARGRRCIGWL